MTELTADENLKNKIRDTFSNITIDHFELPLDLKNKKTNRIYLNFLETHIKSIKNLTINIDTVIKSEGVRTNYEKFKALEKFKKPFSMILFQSNNVKKRMEENDIDWMDVLINSNISVSNLNLKSIPFKSNL